MDIKLATIAPCYNAEHIIAEAMSDIKTCVPSACIDVLDNNATVSTEIIAHGYEVIVIPFKDNSYGKY